MTRLRRFANLMLAMLRELADETAYQRYLAARGCEPSRQQWRKFSDERLRAKYFRPKCC